MLSLITNPPVLFILYFFITSPCIKDFPKQPVSLVCARAMATVPVGPCCRSYQTRGRPFSARRTGPFSAFCADFRDLPRVRLPFSSLASKRQKWSTCSIDSFFKIRHFQVFSRKFSSIYLPTCPSKFSSTSLPMLRSSKSSVGSTQLHSICPSGYGNFLSSFTLISSAWQSLNHLI